MDEKGFRRILNRNVGLPLGLGLVGALFFALLIGYLLNVIRWVEHTDQVLNRASEVYKLTLDLETGMRGFLLSGDEDYLAPYEQARGKYRPLTEQLIGMVGDNPPQVQRLERLLALQEQWDLFAQEVIGSRRDGGNYLAEVGRGRGKNLTDGMRRELDTFINSERELRRQRNAEVSSSTTWGAGIYLVVSILFSALLALFGRRELMNLSQTYSQAMAKQSDYADEQRRRAWLGGGQTLLAERLLGQPQVQELADRSLEFLAEYLNCVVAALYLREAQTGDLTRVAGYGFSEDASLKEHFYRGEGLIGQAARGRRLVCLDDLPADYIKVASSLGEGQPVSVALVPLQSEDRVNGVVELAFMRVLEPREREFLEAIASNVGMALEAARYRQRLQEVLGQTQQLNEELQTQQEELRAANEELEQQARVLKESQAHLETQQAELEQTNEKLSEQAQTLADQRDELDQRNTTLGRIQAQLEERAEELQRASRYKSEFLANMSHELRTPLNAILGFAQLVESGTPTPTPTQKRSVDQILKAGWYLLELINEILDLALIESGKLSLSVEPVSLTEVLTECRAMVESQAAQRGIGMAFPRMPAQGYVNADRTRLKQVLINLLFNAIKYNQPNGRVSVECTEQTAGTLRISVRDTGAGLTPEQVSQLFQPFNRLGQESGHEEGTGIGLVVTQRLVHLMGGDIGADSTQGVGSVFWVEMALASAPGLALELTEEQPAPLAADGAEMHTVLYVEDNPANLELVEQIIARRSNLRLLGAADASLGIEFARVYRPKVILMDINLPGISGIEAMKILRRDPVTAHIPIIALSANAVPRDIQRGMEAGFFNYITKPIKVGQLMDAIDAALAVSSLPKGMDTQQDIA
ncbi:CHASE3 domain-containing protein [Hydrogenophaga sp.]|uniref:CHASE3 domain-containing protein n=1 Tax=Hydrogenophaga sp. TaxID=1904254 RepID=UPI002734F340|nr:CHASE3 domain-containing protein [Hydrogenophaga sp.]